MLGELRLWVRAAEAARPTCINKEEFDSLIERQRLRLASLEGSSTAKKRLSPTQELAEYRQAHPVKPMARKPLNSDETRQMIPGQGLHELPSPPANSGQFRQVLSPPRTREAAPEA
jgi:hypothetical protein